MKQTEDYTGGVLTWHAVQQVTLRWWRRWQRGRGNRWDDSRDACRFAVTGAGFRFCVPGFDHLLVLLLQVRLLDDLLLLLLEITQGGMNREFVLRV